MFKNKFKLILILISIISILLPLVNALSINISSYEPDDSFSIYENVFIIVQDPLGRETGYNPFINKWKQEIPESGSGSDSIYDMEGNFPGPADFGIDITADNIPIGEYKIKIFGLRDIKYLLEGPFTTYTGYISSGTVSAVSFNYDPNSTTQPVLTKVVTIQTLKEDIEVAYKLNQLGDDKFTKSLLSMINVAEKYYNKCQVLNNKSNDKKDIDKRKLCYRPVVATVRMMMKRLEVINKLCDNKTECKAKCKIKTECDEDEAFKGFENKYGRDKDFKEFFEEWDKDEYQIHKKTCKKYITDEALEIITTDINWLIKSLGEEIWNIYQSEHNPYISEKYKSFFK